MRTREEQIDDLANLFGEDGTFTFVDDRDAATKRILEAERRAEQRVRAEIGRDSALLDECPHCERMEFGGACMHENPCPAWEEFKVEEKAIDAAREVG